MHRGLFKKLHKHVGYNSFTNIIFMQMLHSILGASAGGQQQTRLRFHCWACLRGTWVDPGLIGTRTRVHAHAHARTHARALTHYVACPHVSLEAHALTDGWGGGDAETAVAVVPHLVRVSLTTTPARGTRY